MKITLAAILLCGAMAAGVAQAQTSPQARLDTGTVAGATEGAAVVYLGIPYAAPPVGPLRWAPPAPAPRWKGVRAATASTPACPQPLREGGAPNLGGYFGPTSEDCLTLDVTAPPAARKAPVMVWIYGGGNVAGATRLPSYDGVNFARDGVVLVAMNYRLGRLGFFAHPALTRAAPANQPLVNYGLMDQIAALRWVRRNIAAFGGDPANVTVFGESAGGEDVLSLLTIPAARGLFEKAVVQSGGGWEPPVTLAMREAQGAAFAAKQGLPGADATVAQLRALPVEALIGDGGALTGPAVDGRLVTETAAQAFARGDEAPVPLIIGSNSNEASLMGALGYGAAAVVAAASPALKAAYAADAAGGDAGLARALFNDRAMGAPARWIAAHAARKAPAWLYYFSYVPERQRQTRPGTNHASEIPFVFDSLESVPGRAAVMTPGEKAEATLAHRCWVSFARAGRPDCGVAWPMFDTKDAAVLEFGDPPAVRSHFRAAQLDAQEAATRDLIGPN